MQGIGARATIGLLWAAALTVNLPVAQAQDKPLSDKTVATLMQYAWSATPAKMITPTGKVIEVDKTKAKDVIVPMDTAREVVRAGRLSALAQICQLNEEQVANHRTLMRREEAKGKWSDQQMLYINQLHLFTVMAMTGDLKLVEQTGDKPPEAKEVLPAKKGAPAKEGEAANAKCSDEQRRNVQAQIMTYINTTPTGPAGKK